MKKQNSYRLLRKETSTCDNCEKQFDHYYKEKRKFCSIKCSTIKSWEKRPYCYDYEHIDWKLYWKMYHAGETSIEVMKGLMIQRFLNNKAYNTYDLFKPNNIVL